MYLVCLRGKLRQEESGANKTIQLALCALGGSATFSKVSSVLCPCGVVKDIFNYSCPFLVLFSVISFSSTSMIIIIMGTIEKRHTAGLACMQCVNLFEGVLYR